MPVGKEDANARQTMGRRSVLFNAVLIRIDTPFSTPQTPRNQNASTSAPFTPVIIARPARQPKTGCQQTRHQRRPGRCTDAKTGVQPVQKRGGSGKSKRIHPGIHHTRPRPATNPPAATSTAHSGATVSVNNPATINTQLLEQRKGRCHGG